MSFRSFLIASGTEGGLIRYAESDAPKNSLRGGKANHDKKATWKASHDLVSVDKHYAKDLRGCLGLQVEVPCVRRPQVENRDGVTFQVDGIQLFTFPKATKCKRRGAVHLGLGTRVDNDLVGVGWKGHVKWRS